MALSSFAVDKACEILKAVVPEVELGLLFDEVHIVRPGWIRALNFNEDEGCESVFVDVKDITPVQIETFDNLAQGLNNTRLQQDMGNGFTRIGWF